MRATTLAAGGLACAGAAMTIAAFAGGGEAAQPATTRFPHTATDGVNVWIANGCGSCHTFKPAGATGVIGPDLQRTLKGKDRGYVVQSIVLPNAVVASRESSSVMPDGYAKRIAPDDLKLLTDFILAGVHAQ